MSVELPAEGKYGTDRCDDHPILFHAILDEVKHVRIRQIPEGRKR